MKDAAPVQGRVIASFGRHQAVEDDAGQVFDCSRRGRLQDVVCGDLVNFTPSGGGTGVIESVASRKTLLYRSDAYKEKALAANITLALLVVAPVPTPRETLFNRCLIASTAAGIAPLLVANKSDLPEFPAMMALFQYYLDEGLACFQGSAHQDLRALREKIEGHDSIVIGESGMGKSTLINALAPEAALRTGKALSSGEFGKHTTTHARRLKLATGDSITDTPGMQVFGLQHLTQFELESAHPEFREAIGACRFNDCRHDHEPDCAFKAIADRHPRTKLRLTWLKEILKENERVQHWARGDTQF